MKKIKNIVIILMLIVVMTNVCCTISYADSFGKIDEGFADQYEPSELTVADAGDFMGMIDNIISTLRIIGTAVSIITLMVLGIRYMIGSTADKATYKETMVPYLIGAIMTFTIPTMVQIIYDLAKNIHL